MAESEKDLNADFGSTGTWTRFPASGNYYDKLQTNDGDTTYIECSAAGIITFGVEQFSLIEGDIPEEFHIRTYAKGDGGIDTDYKFGVYIYGTVYWHDDTMGVLIAYGSNGQIWEKSPITGLDWTIQELNAIDKIAVDCSNATDPLRITQLYTRVQYLSEEQEDVVEEREAQPYELTTLEGIRNVEMSAMGRTYVDEQGNLRYESRYARNV